MADIKGLIIIRILLQTRGPYYMRNHTTQERKKWLAIMHYKISVSHLCYRIALSTLQFPNFLF